MFEPLDQRVFGPPKAMTIDEYDPGEKRGLLEGRMQAGEDQGMG
jgi:hypothetical protein